MILIDETVKLSDNAAIGVFDTLERDIYATHNLLCEAMLLVCIA